MVGVFAHVESDNEEEATELLDEHAQVMQLLASNPNPNPNPNPNWMRR